VTDPVEEVGNCRRLAALAGRSYPSPATSAPVGAVLMSRKGGGGNRGGTERRDGSAAAASGPAGSLQWDADLIGDRARSIDRRSTAHLSGLPRASPEMASAAAMSL